MLSKSEVKYIQSLSQKKFRDEENHFVAEGPKIVDEALRTNSTYVKKLFATKEWIAQNNTLVNNSELILIDDIDLTRISQLKTPNKVLAVVQKPQNEPLNPKAESIVLALDGIQDPGNMGTILRIADWFGVTQIICSEDCADVYNSKVVQASMGSIFRVEIFYTSLPKFLREQKNTIIYGAALDGVSLKSYKNEQRGILVIGNEGKGIRPEVMQTVSKKITIDKIGAAESLNAAVATGIILSHIA